MHKVGSFRKAFAEREEGIRKIAGEASRKTAAAEPGKLARKTSRKTVAAEPCKTAEEVPRKKTRTTDGELRKMVAKFCMKIGEEEQRKKSQKKVELENAGRKLRKTVDTERPEKVRSLPDNRCRSKKTSRNPTLADRKDHPME